MLAACATSRPRFDREGHRGARGLAPENTLPAFERALDIGVDTLEMDTMLTADDVLVIHHDERLNPDITRDATGAWLEATGPTIHSLTLAELRGYDVGRIKPGTAYAARFPDQRGRDGVRIPTLEEVVKLAEQRTHGHIRYNIEIKTSPERPDDTPPPAHVADKLVEAVRKLGIADRVTIQSFDFRGLTRVAEIAPEIPLSCLTEDKTLGPGMSPWTLHDLDAFHGNIPRVARDAGCTIWSPDERTLHPEQIREAHRRHMRVLPWTVNDPATIARLIDWGVDGVISDYPDRLPRR
jgi:glycerophosphoryl diester phosphodiesterase